MSPSTQPPNSENQLPTPLPLDPAGLNEARLIQFRVRVGHTSVTVRSADRSAAVADARKRLCAELPRMWDLISQMEESRFNVEPATPEE